MAGWASELLGGQEVVTGGIRADFISANFMLAIVILVFVGFFCVRMLSNTKMASCLTAGIFLCVMLYLQITDGTVVPIVKKIAGDPLRAVGAVCCIVSAIAVAKGLTDEETAEKYVHGRGYWLTCIAVLYFGLFWIGAGMNR